MATVIEREFDKFRDHYVQPSVVHCDSTRKGDCVPIAFCQVEGKAMQSAFTCCPKNNYHFLVNGNFADDLTLDEKIANIANRLREDQQVACPTCRRAGVDSDLKPQYNPEVEAAVREYYDHKYRELESNDLRCVKTGKPLQNPVVVCNVEMHGFVDFTNYDALQGCRSCPVEEEHGTAKDLKVHPFLDYAVKRREEEEEALILEYKGIKGEFKGFLTWIRAALTLEPIPLCPKFVTHWIASPEELDDLSKYRVNSCHCTTEFYPKAQRKVHSVLARVNRRCLEDLEDFVPDLSDQPIQARFPHPGDPPSKLPRSPAATTHSPAPEDTEVDINKTLKRICVTAVKIISCIALIILVGVLFVCYKDRIFNYRLSR